MTIYFCNIQFCTISSFFPFQIHLQQMKLKVRVKLIYVQFLNTFCIRIHVFFLLNVKKKNEIFNGTKLVIKRRNGQKTTFILLSFFLIYRPIVENITHTLHSIVSGQINAYIQLKLNQLIVILNKRYGTKVIII